MLGYFHNWSTLHEALIDGPKLLEPVLQKARPELLRLVWQELAEDGTGASPSTVFQLVGLLQGGLEDGFHGLRGDWGSQQHVRWVALWRKIERLQSWKPQMGLSSGLIVHIR